MDCHESEIRSYHVNALYSPWVNLHDLVDEFVTVTHNKDQHGLMEFVNLKLGEVWEEMNPDALSWEQLYNRRETYPTSGCLPKGVLILTAGVDVQHDWLECTVYGWGIEHRIIYGCPDDPQTWMQLDGMLQQQYAMDNGASITISCTCVDSGDGSFTTNVYQYTKARKRMRVFSFKGRGGVGVPFINAPTKGNAVKATLFTLGVDSGKSLVMSRLAVDEPRPNYAHYASQPDRGFTAVHWSKVPLIPNSF